MSQEWTTLIVALELLATLCTSFWLITRQSRRIYRRPLLNAPAPLLQPRGYWSLRALVAFRAGAAVFYFLVQFWDVYRSKGRCLIMYTSWNFILQGVYFFLAAWSTKCHLQRQVNERMIAYTALMEQDNNDGTESSSTDRRRNIEDTELHWIDLELLFDVCLAVSVLICVVVWTILYPYAVKLGHPEMILNGVSYCQHGINVVLLQLDFVATRHLVSRDALPLVMGWPSVYAVFAWIVHGTAAKGFWLYPFLNLKTPRAPLWYGGLLAAHIMALILVMLLSKVKQMEQRSVAFVDQTEA